LPRDFLFFQNIFKHTQNFNYMNNYTNFFNNAGANKKSGGNGGVGIGEILFLLIGIGIVVIAIIVAI
jgi:hypothetical protein